MFVLESKECRTIDFIYIYTSSKIHTLIGHTAEVSSAQFNWDCSRIVTGSMDKTCKLWDTLSGTKKRNSIDFLTLFLIDR